MTVPIAVSLFSVVALRCIGGERLREFSDRIIADHSGHRVRFTTAAALVSELIEARDDKHLLRFQKLLASAGMERLSE